MRRRARWFSLAGLLCLSATLQVAGAGPSHAATNLVDANTSTLEAAIGHWQPWFSTSIVRTTEQAHAGTRSLRVNVTNPWGWGVQWDNWPGLPAAPGDKVISFWARAGSGAGLSPTMSVDWRTTGGGLLRTDTVQTPFGLTTSWSRAFSAVIAPPGTVSFTVEFTDPTGVAGNSLYLDDIVVADVQRIPDVDTSTLENSIGHWVPWSGATIQRAPVANGGNFGLRVDLTSGVWDVKLDSFPTGPIPSGTVVGFPSGSPPFVFGFSARASRAGLGVQMTITYWNFSHNLAADVVSLNNLSPYGWQRASKEIGSSPNGTDHISIEFRSSGTILPGDIIYIDDIQVSKS